MIEHTTEQHKAAITVKGADGWFEAFAKWDGCVDLWFGTDQPEPGEKFESQIHLCDLPRFIAILQTIQEEAKKRDFEGYES